MMGDGEGSMRRALEIVLVFALFVACHDASGCNDDAAFGFRFGQPVPKDATDDVESTWFKGSPGAGNHLESFAGNVPTPLADFDNYVYYANRDRKVAYGVVAYRQLEYVNTQPLSDEELEELRVEARTELERIAGVLEANYGLVYEPDPYTPSGLYWEAETDDVRAVLSVFLGQVIYVDCTNKRLEREALRLHKQDAVDHLRETWKPAARNETRDRNEPVYPEGAVRDCVEGFVTLQFTVTAEGRATNIEIVDANPAGVFGVAAVEAVQKFRYKPRIENGIAVPVENVKTTVKFEIDDSDASCENVERAD